MTTLWGGRLTLYLAYRNLGHGEDYRYQQFRKDAGKWFPIRSLFTVYALQGSIALVVALPLVMSIAQPGVHVSGVGYLGIAIFSVGFVFETLGDFQLTRFKADPSNKGKVLNTGLWRYTRHLTTSAMQLLGGGSSLSRWVPMALRGQSLARCS